MLLGLRTNHFRRQSLTELLAAVAPFKLDTIEIVAFAMGGLSAHCPLDDLLADPGRLRGWCDEIAAAGLQISALNAYANPLHPSQEIARAHREGLRKVVRLAEAAGVANVLTFGGCPGDSDTAQFPNWVTCPWPDDFSRVLEWQWREKVIPFWREEAVYAADHNVRICVEPHPGFVVYNTETMLRLREATGPAIACNFDPSHLFWQAMDPIVAIEELGRAGLIQHVHAKDTAIHPGNTARNGVLDTKPYRNVGARSWVFRTIGYGHGEETWRRIVSALQLVGYRGTLSIEHEDDLASTREGIARAVEVLRACVLREPGSSGQWQF